MGFCKTAKWDRDEFRVAGNGRDGERKEMREMKIKMERYAWYHIWERQPGRVLRAFFIFFSSSFIHLCEYVARGVVERGVPRWKVPKSAFYMGPGFTMEIKVWYPLWEFKFQGHQGKIWCGKILFAQILAAQNTWKIIVPWETVLFSMKIGYINVPLINGDWTDLEFTTEMTSPILGHKQMYGAHQRLQLLLPGDGETWFEQVVHWIWKF